MVKSGLGVEKYPASHAELQQNYRQIAWFNKISNYPSKTFL